MSQLHQGELPATCSTIDWFGALSEGFALVAQSPLTGVVPALFVGSTFCRVDHSNGCTVHDMPQGMLVRRAGLKELPHGGYMNYFLRQPSGDDPYLLVARLGVPKGARMSMRFEVGVTTTGGKVLVSNLDQYLTAIPRGAYVNLFLASGHVVRVVATRAGLSLEKLKIERQAALRIERVNAALEVAKKFEDAERIRREDFALHQLITIMVASAKHSDTIYEGLRQRLEEMSDRGELRPAVSRRVDSILNPVRPIPRVEVKQETALAAALKAATLKASKQKRAG